MRYRELPPPPHLAASVRCFWILEDAHATAQGAVERILPDGCPEIVVHYGQPMRAALDGEAFARQPAAIVGGQLRGALRLLPSGPVGIIGARLQPWAAGPLLRERLDRLTDRIVPLEDFGARSAAGLVERIGEAGDGERGGDEARAALLGEHLAQRLAQGATARSRARDATDSALQAALQCIEATRGAVPVSALAARLQWSPRRMQRSFLAGVGLSPKAMCRIARFRSVVRAVGGHSASPLTLAALAAHAGYADQAHLAREFRELAGLSATAWLAEQHALSDCFTAGD